MTCISHQDLESFDPLFAKYSCMFTLLNTDIQIVVKVPKFSAIQIQTKSCTKLPVPQLWSTLFKTFHRFKLEKVYHSKLIWPPVVKVLNTHIYYLILNMLCL